VVVGSGWIGSEVAASARQKGLEVTLVDPLGVPLERVLGPEVGAIYRDIHADHGVQLALGTGVDAALRSSAPGVVAAGDVAAAGHPLTGGRVRVEHWHNALEQGPAAAR